MQCDVIATFCNKYIYIYVHMYITYVIYSAIKVAVLVPMIKY